MWRCLVLTLTCAACTNPDDILAVHGTVVSVDPVEGQVVRLLRYISDRPNVYVYMSDPCSLATPLKETRVDVEGNFDLELFRVETRRAPCFRVEVQFPSGSIAWAVVPSPFYGPETLLPPLRDWRAAPWLDGGVLHFDPPVPWPDETLPGGRQGVQLTHREQLVTSDGGIAWQAEDRLQLPDASAEGPGSFLYAREALLFDELRLEDFEGALSLSAFLEDPNQRGALLSSETFPARMTAGERLPMRGVRVPLSRGLGCPELATPCPLTDGELTEVDAGLIEEVTFRLVTPAIVSAVVLRGAWLADEPIRVVLAEDDAGIAGEFEGAVPKADPGAFPQGSEFLRIHDGGFAQFRPTYLIIPLDAGTPAAGVTLQFPAGLARIKEVSLFGP